MDLGLSGRVAVVTGGGSGIGAATVALLLQEGARVAVWDIHIEPVTHESASVTQLPDESSIAEALSHLPAASRTATSGSVQNGSVLPVLVDVTDLQQIQAGWRLTESELGPVDILVHAAAIGSGCFGFPFYDVPPAAWSRVLEVNVLGMANVAQIAGPAMAARRTGCMVFIASVAGQMGSQTDPPYSASKAANINFAQCMAKDLALHQVRVNTVCPGMIQTPLNRSVWQAWHDKQPEAQRMSYDEWAGQKIQSVVPLRRWQKPENVADMIVFLCSERASEVTGQTINIDGGTVMHW